MKVSELLADLTSRPQSQNALVVLVETDSAGNTFTVESSVRESNEKVVILQIKSMRGPLERFPDILLQSRPHRRYRASICESVVPSGKFQVNIDGRLLGLFDTQAEAKLFLQGFVLGAETGAAEKGLNPLEGAPNA
jgi:hypothetical protein